MKIKESNGSLVDVFAVHWHEDKTSLFGLPEKYGGLAAYKDKEVRVIDPGMKFRGIILQGKGYGFYHWALIEKGLFSALLELDKIAYEQFLTIIKQEGLVDKSFY
ncbi:MAG: hypothetical protein ACRCTY_00345 [Candidatus Adiutrix sp.]